MRLGSLRALIAVGIGFIASPAFAAETITYGYDALGRIMTVVHKDSVNNNQQTIYTIDPADNRTNVATTGAAH